MAVEALTIRWAAVALAAARHDASDATPCADAEVLQIVRLFRRSERNVRAIPRRAVLSFFAVLQTLMMASRRAIATA